MCTKSSKNKLASLEATLVRNSAQRLTDSLTGVKCRATSVAKKVVAFYGQPVLMDCQIHMDPRRRRRGRVIAVLEQHLRTNTGNDSTFGGITA